MPSRWAAATSRTSTIGMYRSGKAGISPSSICRMRWLEPETACPGTGPITATGSIVRVIRPALGRHEGPGGALREGLALAVGVDARPLGIGPVGLGQDLTAAPVTPAHRMEGGGEDDAVDPRRRGRPENAQGAVDRGDDQFILIGDASRPRRGCDVEEDVHAGERLGATRVARKIRGDELKPSGLGHSRKSDHANIAPGARVSISRRSRDASSSPTGL